MIPPETIEQVRQATDIVQIIGEFVRLKKKGRRFLAVCPFHTEKTPSFSVSPDKQLYYCFGCGKGGTVFTFLMEHEKMSFVEAVRDLARRANITIREEAGSDVKREFLERISYGNQVALDYFHHLLYEPKYREVLQNYLKGKRGIIDETIAQFKLGLAGETWDGLVRYAAGKGLSSEDLEKAGLSIRSETKGNYFDRFRQRLMFPIFNLSQKPIAFGGRTLKKGEPAKYVNSPETPLYVKGNVLYGLNFSKDYIRQASPACVFVVEGYFDFISLWQVGVKNVVASSGTAFTLQQARLLARFAEEVYLFFDADTAGQNAALRSVDSLFEAGLEVKVIVPPAGEDPDSIATGQGMDGIEKLQHDALGFIRFRTKDLDIGASGIIGKERLVKELGALGSKISDPTRRSLYFAEAAETLGVDVQLLQKVPAKDRGTPAPDDEPKRKHSPIEIGFLSLLFNNPGSIDSIFENISPDDFESSELSRLYSAMINQYQTAGAVDAKVLVDNAKDSEFASLVTEIASTEWDPAQLEGETRKLVKQIIDEKQKRIRARLRKELAQAETEGNHEEANRILQQMKDHGLYAD
ncbi:MAG: DNA primase [Candidatus Zixiibacteriota bacterium]|nr:MAG: DNA primase [candidate division Zixibacteria bacterium]